MINISQRLALFKVPGILLRAPQLIQSSTFGAGIYGRFQPMSGCDLLVTEAVGAGSAGGTTTGGSNCDAASGGGAGAYARIFLRAPAPIVCKVGTGDTLFHLSSTETLAIPGTTQIQVLAAVSPGATTGTGTTPAYARGAAGGTGAGGLQIGTPATNTAWIWQDVGSRGQSGEEGCRMTAAIGRSGAGGSGPFGSGGLGLTSSTAAGNAGVGFGTGGGGGLSISGGASQAGGAAANGCIYYWEFSL